MYVRVWFEADMGLRVVLVLLHVTTWLLVDGQSQGKFGAQKLYL